MPYAVAQDGYAIFGIGATRQQAIKDAAEWTDEEDLADLPDRPHAHGDMFIAPCTEALAAKVKSRARRSRQLGIKHCLLFRRGGDIVWTLNGGTICLPDEED